jgi:hypothetical protein
VPGIRGVAMWSSWHAVWRSFGSYSNGNGIGCVDIVRLWYYTCGRLG